MGRHEGPKALISERTPRQTERKKEKERRTGRRREGRKESGESECEGIEKGERRRT